MSQKRLRTRLRHGLAIVAAILIVYQTGACCGCDEHNYWLTLLDATDTARVAHSHGGGHHHHHQSSRSTNKTSVERDHCDGSLNFYLAKSVKTPQRDLLRTLEVAVVQTASMPAVAHDRMLARSLVASAPTAAPPVRAELQIFLL